MRRRSVLLSVAAVVTSVVVMVSGCAVGPNNPTAAGGCATDQVAVPDLVGSRLADAYESARASRLLIGDVTDATGQGRHVIDRDNWRVVAQTPQAKVCLDRYGNPQARQVSLKVVKYTDPVGPDGVTLIMPDYVGQELRAVKAEVRLMVSSKNGITTTDLYDGYAQDSDRVVSTSPPPGEPVRGPVELTVVSAEVWDFFQANPTMPDLTGSTWNYNVGPALRRVATEVVEKRPPSGHYSGDHIVTRTDPAPGEPLAVGQKITVYTEIRDGGTMPRTGGGRPVYYENCAAARAAGVAPLYVWEDGYRIGLDADGDGIACE